jgi:GDSL-like Lipase/Acylhydrolase family
MRREERSGRQEGNHQTQCRSAVIATENLSSFRVAFAGFYNGANIGGPISDTGLGAATAITASIEYPAGTFTRLKFSASANGPIPDIGVLFSDNVNVNIPAGSTYWIPNLRTNPNGILFNAGEQNTFLGEACEVAASGLTDKTMVGGIVDSGAGFSVPPLAVLGMTTNPSVIIIGDSIAAGFHDTEASGSSATGFNGKIGVIARSLGNTPFLNLAVNGENAYTWSADATGRNQLIQKGSHLISELGFSDVINHGKTVAQTETALQSVYALARAGQKIYQTTWTPDASDSGSPSPVFTTLNQQTALNNAARTTFNTDARAILANTLGTIDVASVLESSLNSGKWVVTPSPSYVFDNPGVHPNPAGYWLVQNAGIFPALTYP